MWSNALFKLLGVAAVVVVFWFFHELCVSGVSADEPIPRNDRTDAPAPTTSPAATDTIRGMAIQINYTVDGVDRYLTMIDEIAALGANTVGLSTAGYQEHAGSAWISLDHRYSPTKRQFAALIARARKHGLTVALMPVILLKNPRGSEWRGVIQPPDWDQWFSSYLAFIKFFAQVGLENDVELMAIGAELVSTESMRDRWTRIIEEVRKTYHGRLYYSANWDHYKQVTFWDKLDIVGMTTYHQLADEENAPLSTLLESWAPIKDEILAWRRSAGKPILFTEVGWCSQPGAAIEAWNYYRHQAPSREGLEEQATCYRAFIETWRNTPGVAGAMWWEWTDAPGGPDDYGYTPKGKPAEQVLRRWFRDDAWGATTTQGAAPRK